MSKPSKGTIETIKTVIISVLVTGIIAFIGGMQYAQHQQSVLETAVQTAVETPVETSVKK